MNSKKKKREPNCALCWNHGTKVLLKGHKRHCIYRDCKCYKCNETRKRQEYMADMQYIKRNGVAEEARLGKRADMLAIFNERMKTKKNKKKMLESGQLQTGELVSSELMSSELASGDSMAGDSVSLDLDDNLKSISLEDVDSVFQIILNYFHHDLKIKDEDDILYIALLVYIQEFHSTHSSQLVDNILNVYKEM